VAGSRRRSGSGGDGPLRAARSAGVSPRARIIGLGNAARSDDAAGIEAVARLGERARAAGIDAIAHEGEALELLELWRGAESVVLLDALHAHALHTDASHKDVPPGSLLRFDASREPLPARVRAIGSTHATTVHEAIELARALGRLPRRIVLLGVVGLRFEAGLGLSREVGEALEPLARAALEEARGGAIEMQREPE
jgi:hydrogenase maturation protease